MQLPTRRTRRPKITLGQILASIAVSSVPIAAIMRSARGLNSAADLAADAILKKPFVRADLRLEVERLIPAD